MNNEELTALRDKWLETKCYKSLHEFLDAVMCISGELARLSHMKHATIHDIAHDTSVEVYTNMATVKDLMEYVRRVAWKRIKREYRRLKRHEELVANIVERAKQEAEVRRKPNQASKDELVNIVETALVPREWQVIHRHFWQGKDMVEVAVELRMHRSTAHRLRNTAYENIKMALRRLSITAANWQEWYYETVL